MNWQRSNNVQFFAVIYVAKMYEMKKNCFVLTWICCVYVFCVVSLRTSLPFGIRITSEADETFYTKWNSGNQVAATIARGIRILLCERARAIASVFVNERQQPNKTDGARSCVINSEQLSWRCIALRSIGCVQFVSFGLPVEQWRIFTFSMTDCVCVCVGVCMHFKFVS